MRRSLVALGLLLGLVSGSSRTLALDPPTVYRNTVGGVVWIENYLPGNRVTSGSGFLVDRSRRLVVTNYHVTDNEETVDVYFPVRAEGKIADDRDDYRKNRTALAKAGAYSPGRVVAYSTSQDLAVLSLRAIPDAAPALRLATTDPQPGSEVNLIGNPAGRPLWRWCAGTKPGVGRVQATYKGFARGDLSVDFKAIHCYASSFGGNSGGPMLNDDGEVVGVCQSGGGEGGLYCSAVHYSEVKELLATIRLHRVFSIDNASSVTLSYQVRWGDGEWKNAQVKPKHHMVHWLAGGTDAKPQVRFDCSTEPGFQEKVYTLDYYTSHLGRNVKPSRDRDAREYYFQFDQSGQVLDLYSKP
ncbi:MAG TPA: serine protease [Gemmataceae bacterium]|nr:serine protease [Gemmataceae bacterium]